MPTTKVDAYPSTALRLLIDTGDVCSVSAINTKAVGSTNTTGLLNVKFIYPLFISISNWVRYGGSVSGITKRGGTDNAGITEFWMGCIYVYRCM